MRDEDAMVGAPNMSDQNEQIVHASEKLTLRYGSTDGML